MANLFALSFAMACTSTASNAGDICELRMEVGVGGLVFSTVVTLLVLPAIDVLMDDLRNWARGIVKKAKVTTT